MRRRAVWSGGERWALFADLHIPAEAEARKAGFSPVQNLLEAVRGALSRRVQACLINGDVSWSDGLEGDYRVAREMLDPLLRSCPTAILPGNHDQRALLGLICCDLQEDRDRPTTKLVEVVEFNEIKMIGLDSLLRTDIVGGLVGKEQRDWLSSELRSQPTKPTVIAVHHPLQDDDDSLLDSDRLLELVVGHPQVKAIFTAHDHVFRHAVWRGVHLISQPAIGFAFDADGSAAWLEARFEQGGVALRPIMLAGPALRSVRLRWAR